MQIPLADSGEKDNQASIKEMFRTIERQRIIMEAQLVKDKLQKIKTNFDNGAKSIASQTKSSIQSLANAMDKSIKGAVRTELEATVKDNLQKYDSVM